MLEKLSDLELEAKLKILVSQEREILENIILHVQEVEKRKLYLRRARSNLYDYLVIDMAYAPACAQRRIDAARLTKEIPEVLEKVKNGSLNLSQIAALQQSARLKNKMSIEKVTTAQKREIIDQIENKSIALSQKTIAQELDLPVLEKTKTKVQKDDSVRLEMTLDRERWEALKRCKDLLGHQVRDGDLSEVIGHLCEFFQSKRDPLVKKTREQGPKIKAVEKTAAKALAPAPASPSPSPSSSSSSPINLELTSTSAAEVTQNKKRYVTQQMRRAVFKRDRACQYKDPETGQVCGSRYQLEIDHKKMFCHGGDNQLQNLRIVCRQHNFYLAKLKLGSDFMTQFVPSS